MKKRLQKLLAEAGFGSRRASEDLIRAGRVTVDGVVAAAGRVRRPRDPGGRGRRAAGLSRETKEYWLLNKPAGVLSAVTDPRGRPTVVDCVPTARAGLPGRQARPGQHRPLLLTNDGDLAGRCCIPATTWRRNTPSRCADGSPGEGARLRRGVVLEDGPTAPAVVEVIEARDPPRTPTTTLRMVIHEGRKRQVRRMLESVGHGVVALHRCSFGGLTDAGLALGRRARCPPPRWNNSGTPVTRVDPIAAWRVSGAALPL